MGRAIDELIAPVYFEAWNDFVSGSASEQWFAGGRYSAKSSFVSIALVAGLCAVGNEMKHAACFRKHKEDLRDSVYNQVEWAILEMGLEREFEFLKVPLVIRRRSTGQTVFFYGLDDPEKHKAKKPPRGGYFGYLWFEELAEFSGEAEIRSVETSLQRGPAFHEFTTYNPPASAANWVNTEAAVPKPGRKVYHSDYRDLPEGWMSAQTLERIEWLRKRNPTVWRHEYLGEQVGTGTEVFGNLVAREITDAEVAEWRGDGRIRWGMDFGIENDPTVLVGSAYSRDAEELFCFDEWWSDHPFFTTVHAELERRGLLAAPIVADTAPAGWYQNINNLGARLRGCHKAEDWPRIGVQWIRTRTRLVVDPKRCPRLWEELRAYQFDVGANGRVRENFPDRDNHGIDALRYGQEDNIMHDTRRRFVGAPKAFARGRR